MPNFGFAWQVWLRIAITLGGAVVLALIVHAVLFAILARLVRRRHGDPAHFSLRHARRPLQWLLPILALSSVWPTLPLPGYIRGDGAHILGVATVGALAWLIIALLMVFEELFSQRFRIEQQDNLRARRVRTQLQLLRRIMAVMIVLLAVAISLMTIPAVRQVGAGLFASAGLAGLIAGMAARPTISSLIAGVQIALTEPIRIEDVVIVENEWGWIEEIHTTYVVVRIWDLRRMVLPLTYFIEKPFQNWTRRSADLIGSVHLFLDYSVPIEALRQKVQQVLQSTPLWDGRVWNLQVTDATDRVLQVRALMSASDSGKAWDLRCYVREQLIAWLQQNHPGALPRLRAELDQAARPELGAGKPEPQAKTAGPEPGAAPRLGPSTDSQKGERQLEAELKPIADETGKDSRDSGFKSGAREKSRT